MKGMILKYIIVFALVMFSGTVLVDVSQRVQRAERDIKRYDHIIAREEESIRALKAEWAYLNNPARLERLVSGGLNLISPAADHLISDISPPPVQPSIFTPARSALHRDIVYHPVPSLPLNITPSVNQQIGGAQE